MLNRVVLTGRLTRDPELRYTGSGTAVCSFTVAVDRQFRNQQGERDADFINCVIWRKSAENFANFTSKGSLVGIDGRLSTRNYENQQGQRVYVTEVSVDNFALLEPRGARQNNGNQGFNQQGFGGQGNFGGQGGFNQGNQAFDPNKAFNNNAFGGNQSAPQASGNNSNPFDLNNDNNVDLNSLPFDTGSNAGQVDINNQSANSANSKPSSADDQGEKPSEDNLPF